MHPELLYKSSPLESSKAYIMEFTDYLEQCVSDKSGEPLSLHRQRILAAQIQDGELGTEDVLLANADTFDSSVETVSGVLFFYERIVVCEVLVMNSF